MYREYSLVDGEFKSEEAKEILLNIIQEKIRFHDVQILRKKERNEKDVEKHIRRVQDLKTSRENILEVLANDSEAGFKLKAVLTLERIS